MSGEVLEINPEVRKNAEVKNMQNALNTAINSFEDNPSEENFKKVVVLFDKLCITNFIPGSRITTSWGEPPEGEYVTGDTAWDSDKKPTITYQKDTLDRTAVQMDNGTFYALTGNAQQMKKVVELSILNVLKYLRLLAQKSKEIYDKEIEKTQPQLKELDRLREDEASKIFAAMKS